MKQRIRVVGIVRRGADFLFVKRVGSRLAEEPFWELPTGKIQLGEQPEEAMHRTLFDFLGIYAQKISLKDVTTFVALEGSNRLNNLYIIYEIEANDNARIEPNTRYSAYKYVDLKSVDTLKINEASLAVLRIEGQGEKVVVGGQKVVESATVYVDGSSRGNPGPSGVGYYIVSKDGKVLSKGGEYIGFATSRVAEYQALRIGAQKAKELGLNTVRFVSDNLMMVNQLRGVYRVKNEDLLPLYDEVVRLLAEFEQCEFIHVKRELNREADKEANKIVDRHFEKNVIL